MSQNEFEVSKEELELFSKINSARESLHECDEFMQQTKAKIVSLAIDLTTLEMNLYLKKLFLCNVHNLAEEQYIWLTDQLMAKINLIFKVVEERFGRDKKNGAANTANKEKLNGQSNM